MAKGDRKHLEEGRVFIELAMFHALLSNGERYKYIAGLVATGELNQYEATAKNIKKAKLLADAFIKSQDA